ncbi:hypothetical protein ELG63_36390 [Rhizobium leguminosarum]|uniref:hypothetical protein n=1 Tax=Rhizobium leguminosarum TaxID=384 RepID=UPI001031C401|nr:hypothetical protein [Rhizobium leguminosarum]TBH28169.1 hypothetical protein ELG63_36390 [Rhizobium leguminosarum]
MRAISKMNLPFLTVIAGFVLMIAGYALVGSVMSGAAFLFMCYSDVRWKGVSPLGNYLFQNWLPALFTISAIAGGFYEGFHKLPPIVSLVAGKDSDRGIRAIRSEKEFREQNVAALCSDYFSALREGRVNDVWDLEWCELKGGKYASSAVPEDQSVKRLMTGPSFPPERMKEIQYARNFYTLSWDELLHEEGLLEKVLTERGFAPVLSTGNLWK